MKTLNLHLVSDSTGETLITLARAVMAQFESVETDEVLHALTRTKSQMEKVIESIRCKPGVIFHTIVDKEMSNMLAKIALELKLPCVPALDRFTNVVSNYLNMGISPQIGKQHELDEDYFRRVEAINYTLAHDDGQNYHDLEEADIILVGVSRTSKTPTCVYLANRGYKVANIPFILGAQLPEKLFTVAGPLIVGLTLHTDRLVQIRKNRLLSLKDKSSNEYTDIDKVESEVQEAKKLFQKQHWPVIDVSRRSVEETSTTIIQFYQARTKAK